MSVSVAKNYVAVVVDVSAAEDCAIDERKKKLVQTVEAAKSVLKFKSMFSPKNSILIVCVGTKETNNDLSDDDGYNNISVVQPLSMIEGSSFNALETSKVLAAPAAGDVLSGVVVALELLKGADKPPSGRMPPKELIIISDGGTPADDNPDSIMSIAGQLTGNKISTSLM